MKIPAPHKGPVKEPKKILRSAEESGGGKTSPVNEEGSGKLRGAGKNYRRTEERGVTVNKRRGGRHVSRVPGGVLSVRPDRANQQGKVVGRNGAVFASSAAAHG